MEYVERGVSDQTFNSMIRNQCYLINQFRVSQLAFTQAVNGEHGTQV